MDFIGGALPNVMLITGLIAIGIGLGIEFKIVEVKGDLSRTSRIGAIVVGMFLIGSSVYLYTRPPQAATSQAETPTVQPAGVAAAGATAPAAVPAPTSVSAPTAVPEVTVPDIRGKNTKDAQKILSQAGLSLGEPQRGCAALGATPSDRKLKKDAIVCQMPEPNSRAPRDSAITYVLAEENGR